MKAFTYLLNLQSAAWPAQQPGPGFGAISAVFGQERVPAAAVGLPIECALCNPTDIDRAIEAGGQGIGLVIAARAQQLGPDFNRDGRHCYWYKARTN